MSKDVIEVKGEVTTVLPGAKFKVELENGQEIVGHLSGKMRQHFIKIVPGDLVRVEMTEYDLTVGRITYREKR